MDWRTENHLRTANHHYQVASGLARTNLPDVAPNQDDWVVIALFYSAVHYVTAYFFEFHGLSFTTHVERRLQMARDARLDSIVDAYADLEAWSRVARYDANPTFSDARVQEAFDHSFQIGNSINDLLSRQE